MRGKEIENKHVKDHLGNEFNSMAEMCRCYGLSVNTVKNRLKWKNWTLKDVLETPTGVRRKMAIS